METLLKQLSGLLIPLALVVVALIVISVLKGILRGKTPAQAEPEDLPYALRSSLMTPAERSFFAVLEGTVDKSKYYVFPQISLASLVGVERGTASPQSYHNRIDRKTIDFVLLSKDTVAPVLTIELDDSSHKREDRQERDAFVDAVLAKARLPILHVKASVSYDPRTLAGEISTAVTAGWAAHDTAQGVKTEKAQ